MRKKLIPFLLMVIMASFGSCVGDDIDDLQGQIDDLSTKVDDLEESQQAALLDEIAALQETIAALQAAMEEGNSDLADQYDALLSRLQLLEDEVANNADAVYYGNLLTDDDFDALTNQGATIVTGKVIVNKQAHIDALQAVKMIGGSLKFEGAQTISLLALENVAGDLIISRVENAGAVVSIPSLASVGGDFIVENNMGISSVSADELVLILGKLQLEKNPTLTSVSMGKLDVVNELYINDYNENDPSYIGLGQLVDIDLSNTDVKTNVNVSYLGRGANLSLGEIGNDFICSNTGVDTLVFNSEKISGDFTLTYNGLLEKLVVDNLTRIEGALNISSNDNMWMYEPTFKGLETMPSFDVLDFIGGDVFISSNAAMKTMDAFNNVEEIQGANITISNNGVETELINVFNSVVSTGASMYSHSNILVYENVEWFIAFSALEKANNIDLTVSVTMDPSTYVQGEICKLEGFNALVEVNSLRLTVNDVTSFSAFPSLNNFKSYSEYLSIAMPSDTAVGLCSMEPIFAKIQNGDFDVSWSPNRKATFNYNWVEMDRELAIEQLLSSCN